MNTKTLKLPFTKMTGAGNDFIMIDNRDGQYSLDWSMAAKSLCDRHYGIGGDGLIVLEKSEKADFRMNYFNSDGSYGGMCGNGGRCAAQFAVAVAGTKRIRFEALDHIYSANFIDNKIFLSMKDPTSLIINKIIELNNVKLRLHYIDTGSPHVVILTDNLSEDIMEDIRVNGISEIGRLIRFHAEFAPEGVNVNFITVEADHSVSMRTYERGVEGETLACGTGSVASAIVANHLLGLHSPIFINTKSKERLAVTFDNNGILYTNIRLSGPAKKLFEGSTVINTESYDLST